MVTPSISRPWLVPSKAARGGQCTGGSRNGCVPVRRPQVALISKALIMTGRVISWTLKRNQVRIGQQRDHERLVRSRDARRLHVKFLQDLN